MTGVQGRRGGPRPAQAATAVDVHRVVLADGTTVDPSEVLYPTYHPTEGLSP